MNLVLIISLITAGVILLLGFSRRKESLKYLFYFWIIAFHFGPRTIQIGGIKFFYIEGVTWLMFIVIVLRINSFFSEYNRIFPKYTNSLFIVCTIGLLTAAMHNLGLKNAFYEFKIFLDFIPVFYLTYVGFKYLNIRIEKIVWIFAIGGFILALGGILFFYFPGLKYYIPKALITGESILVDIEPGKSFIDYNLQILRAPGSFWGHPIISAYLLLLLFSVYIQQTFSKDVTKKSFCLSTWIFLATYILISGHRSAWIGGLFGILILSYFRGMRALSVFILIGIIFLFFIPQIYILRFLSLLNVSDLTWAGRVSRYENALHLIKQYPFLGMGWGGCGWPHNFILKIGANLGLIGILIFLLWLGSLFFRSVRSYIRFDSSIYLRSQSLAFISSFVAFMGPFLGQAVINYPNIMIPFWFICAVLHNFNNKIIINDSL